jgi:NACHT domain
MTEILNPEAISRFKKQRFLLEMSEDAFRDEVVRPLFLRQGLGDGRDLCGPFEKGKDALFVSKNALDIEDVYVVQTKKGSINLASKVQANLMQALTQLRTACETKVAFINTKRKVLPAKVILCVSGTINDAARSHISEEIDDPRLLFLDSNELIPKIDQFYPELWLGIDAEIAPYFRRLKQIIEDSDDTSAIAEILPRESQAGVATDRGFVMLQLYRMTMKTKKQSGQVIRVLDMEQMPVTGVLNRRTQRLFVIFGSAGSGKSTSLKRIAYVLATRGLKFNSADQPKIPILLRAPSIAGNLDRSLVEICDAESRRITGHSTPSFSVQDVIAGRLVILVDALDEIPDDEGRSAVLSHVLRFHSEYPDCIVVVTSRDHQPVQTLASLRDFEKYNLSPIDYKQAQQIIKAVQKGRNLPPEKSQELCRRLEEVHGMELNPLLVTVFAATSEYSRQDIPANITELFKKFTEMMLGRWDANKGFKHQYQAPLKDFILTKVAFAMHKDRTTTMDSRELDRTLKVELASRGYDADMEQLRDEILNRSGLFRVTGQTIEFRHLLIQEFFAGRGIPSVEYLHTIVADPWWRRAIVFYFGDDPDNSGVLRSAIAALQGRTIEENYNAALTLGLALQASYLVEVKDKIDIYRWVVDGLSNARDEFLKAGPGDRLPLSRFIFYYLYGRDSVALSVLEQRAQEILGGWAGSELSKDDRDIRTFWTTVGLIECGATCEAERAIQKFKPADSRLLLALHLGCFLILQNVRVSTKLERDAAKKICDGLSGRVAHLRTQLVEEMKAELLEIRKGAIKTIQLFPAADETGQDEKRLAGTANE